MVEDCIFDKIARGEIPAKVVYEDDYILAFDDISPQAPVHTLIITKAHYEHIGDDLPGDEMARLFLAVPVVAKIKGVDLTGYRTIVNTGPDAGQTVNHVHVHVIGGAPLGGQMVCPSGE